MMTLSDTAGKLSSWLRTRHIKVLLEWTEACVDWIQNECQGEDLSLSRLREVVYDQWLDSDLAEIASPSLPEGLAQVQKRSFQGAFALQINSIQDVGSSAYSQLIKIKGKENENVSVTATQATQSKFEPKPTRMLMMEVTDGHQTLQAMEYQPIAALNTDTPPGTKILVHGDIMCRLGVLTLTGAHVTVLGGEVESLIEENSQDKLLARIIGTSLDDIPGGPAKTVQPQSAAGRERDARTTGDNRQQQPAVTARRQPAHSGNVASSLGPGANEPDDDFPEMVDDDVLAGIDEEILRELEESGCSKQQTQKGSTNIKQPPTPEWPSDEDTDEEMLAAMIDNLEEQIKARGDTTTAVKKKSTRPATFKNGSSSQAPRTQKHSSSTSRKQGDSSMKQAPINSFLRPKLGINEDAVKQEQLSTRISKQDQLSTHIPSFSETGVDKPGNRTSVKSHSTSSQFSAQPRQLPPVGRKDSSSSFVKAAPVKSAVLGTIPARSGFVKAQKTIAAPELDNSQTSDYSAPGSKLLYPVAAGNNKDVIRPPLKCGPSQTIDPTASNQPNRRPPQSSNTSQGVFIKAEPGTSTVCTLEKSNRQPGELSPAESSTAPIKPFAQTNSQHPKMAVAARFSKEREEESHKLSLKRRRSSSSTGPAPFRYLSDVMDSNPTESFTFDIRGFIMTLLSSLSKEGDQWSLRVKLNDGSASIDALLGNEVLQGLIGFSVSEMKQMRATVKSQDEKAAVEAVQKDALDQCRKKLVDLCEVMTIRMTPGECPTVIRTRRVEQTDIERMKKCLE